MKEILTIDQGTTSSRSIIFNDSLEIVHESQQEYDLFFPKDGWVEANPNDILDSVKKTLNTVLGATNSMSNIACCGITNQRESTIIWEKSSGKAIYPVIIWQDRRTAELCNKLKQDSGIVKMVSEKTGLLIDPYFSATKIKWILDNVEGARKKAENGELAFGTIDSFLIWNLTEEKNHLTDVTNASRTLLYNINSLDWDEELLNLFNIPKSLLPNVVASDAAFGKLRFDNNIINITGVLGDQQSAMVGQNCFDKGSMKSTYGTGCFLMVNTKDEIFRSNSGLLSTIGYQINGETAYAVEGSIFSAGTIIQWLRDEMSFFEDSRDSEAFIDINGNTNNLLFIPAFTGLGAPYWSPNSRGLLSGLTRNTDWKDIVRAVLESVAYQSFDLFKAMNKDGLKPREVKIDGGMVLNNWFSQFLSDILDVKVIRPKINETTALGAAFVAGLYIGEFKSLKSISRKWKIDKRFDPKINKSSRIKLLKGWEQAIKRTLI